MNGCCKTSSSTKETNNNNTSWVATRITAQQQQIMKRRNFERGDKKGQRKKSVLWRCINQLINFMMWLCVYM